jgi:hypothetical protein
MPLHRPTLLPGIALWCVATTACGGAPDRAGAAAVSDSAGVRMVLNAGVSFEAGVAEWRISDRPNVVIGVAAGQSEYQFDRIMGVQRLSDGRWVVADMGSSQLRYYDAAGGHLHSVGRSGEGPGEFRQVMGMYRLAGDTVAVDDSRTRIHFIDGNGAFVGQLTLPGSPVGERTVPVASFRDGTIVARTTSASPQTLDAPHTMTYTYQSAALVHDGASSRRLVLADTIGTWGAIRLVPGWRGSAQPVQFDGRTQTGVLSDGVVVADPMQFELRVYSADGRLRTVARTEWTPQPVSATAIEQARSAFTGATGEGGRVVPPQLRQQRQDIADTWQIATHMPAFSAMIIDRSDNIWLREYVPNEETVGMWVRAPLAPARWLAFASGGEVLARVELPARFAPLIIGADYIAGIYRDDMEVEYVHSYALTRR